MSAGVSVIRRIASGENGSLDQAATMRIRAALLALSLFVVTASGAQTPVLRQGDRVRVNGAATSGKHITGILTRFDTAALTLTAKDKMSPLAVPWSGVSRLAVSEARGRRQGAVHSAKWGLGIGAVMGLLLVLGPPLEDETMSEPHMAASALANFTIIGAMWGAVRPGRRWRAMNVAEARASATRQPAIAERVSGDVREASVSLRAGTTPAVEFTIGASGPRSQYAEFPGLGVQLAANYGWKPRLGVALVADALADLHHTAVLGGGRIYVRNAPLFTDGEGLTFFAQVLGGKMRAESSGVVHSTGGPTIQPGIGIDYGIGSRALRIQLDRTVVRNGTIHDDRVASGPVGRLTSTRVFAGVTLRSPSW